MAKLAKNPGKRPGLYPFAQRKPERAVFVGGIDDFGQLVVNNQGQLVYESLVKLIKKHDVSVSRVWKIYSDSTSVYFCTLQNIYIYNQTRQTVEQIELPSDSFWSFFVNNTLYVGNYNQGLLHLQDGKL
jgi:hypothetical protein